MKLNKHKYKLGNGINNFYLDKYGVQQGQSSYYNGLNCWKNGRKNGITILLMNNYYEN